MIWQDPWLSLIGILFGIFLLPMLKDAWKGRSFPNEWSATMTAMGLYSSAFLYVTLELWLAAITTTITGTIWAAMMLLRYRKRGESYGSGTRDP